MGASNGRTKRSIERGPSERQRSIGAQTDRQTLQALELIRRAFSGMQNQGRGSFQGSTSPFGRMPTDPDFQGIKGAYLDSEMVNHFGDVGPAWPYDPQTTSDHFYGPGDMRGRAITAKDGRGIHSALDDFGDYQWGGYHTTKGGGSHATSRGRPGRSI